QRAALVDDDMARRARQGLGREGRAAARDMEHESTRADRVGQNAVVEEDGKIGGEGLTDAAALSKRLHGVHVLPFAKRMVAKVGPQDLRLAAPLTPRIDGKRNNSVRRVDAIQRLLVVEM